MGAGNATLNDCVWTRHEKSSRITGNWQRALVTSRIVHGVGKTVHPALLKAQDMIPLGTYVLHEEVEAKHGSCQHHQLYADVLRNRDHAK
jgi:hypothetical protein